MRSLIASNDHDRAFHLQYVLSLWDHSDVCPWAKSAHVSALLSLKGRGTREGNNELMAVCLFLVDTAAYAAVVSMEHWEVERGKRVSHHC